MSRIGRIPIPIPPSVKVRIEGATVTVEGPKGKLTHTVPDGFVLEETDGLLRLKRSADDRKARALHGLNRSLIANMVKGVTEGFVKELELMGVGYRAQISGKNLELFVGFTHPVVYPIPEQVTVEVPKPTQIVVRGSDKYWVGQVAARIRSIAPPEPYKGKGIRYAGEVIRRKAGKAVA